MTSHQVFRDRLGDFADGALAETAAAEFLAHRRDCPECDRLAGAYLHALQDLHELPRLPVPSGFSLRVLERTTRRGREASPWSSFWIWLGLPRLQFTPAATAALFAMLFIFLAGTPDGHLIAREFSMATHQTYSSAVRLYYRSSDLKDTAQKVGRRIPGQIEDTVEWIRRRLEPAEKPGSSPGPDDTVPRSYLPAPASPRA